MEKELIKDKAVMLGGDVKTCEKCEHKVGEYCTLPYHGYEMGACEIIVEWNRRW